MCGSNKTKVVFLKVLERIQERKLTKLATSPENLEPLFLLLAKFEQGQLDEGEESSSDSNSIY